MKTEQQKMKQKGFDFDLDFHVKSMLAAIKGTMTYEKVFKTDKILKKKRNNVAETPDFIFSFLQNEVYMPPIISAPENSYLSWFNNIDKTVC